MVDWFWVISARVHTEKDGWKSNREIPTFYLAENVQGIVDTEHAQKVAKSIIDPFNQYETTIDAYRVEP